jgi:PAS domain S-box-containing protein/diguanylate cyclase (GGDEF)-like protein
MSNSDRPDDTSTPTRSNTPEKMDHTAGHQPSNDTSDQVLPENYRSCLDAIPDLMCLKGGELEYLFVNRAFCSLLGISQEQIVGKRSADIFPKDTARKMETMDLLVLATSKKAEVEVVIKDRLFEIRKFPVNLQDRGLIVISGRDITERKEAEKALLSEKIRFQILSDNAPAGMMLLDPDGSVKYLNARFKEIFGYDTEDITDGNMWYRRSFPDRHFETDISAVITGSNEVKGWAHKQQHLLTAICRNGTQKTVTVEAVQLVSGDIVISCDDKPDRAMGDDKAILKVDYDALTGLPNRLSMERAMRIAVDHAAQAMKRRSLSAALFIEIKDYMELTGKHGRITTDEIVKSLGNLLKDILRADDNGYRCGTGQFGVVFKGISMAEAHLAAERILMSLTGIVFQIGTEKVHLNLGLALVQIDGKKEPGEIFSSAAKTLAKVSAKGHDRINVVDMNS